MTKTAFLKSSPTSSWLACFFETRAECEHWLRCLKECRKSTRNLGGSVSPLSSSMGQTDNTSQGPMSQGAGVGQDTSKLSNFNGNDFTSTHNFTPMLSNLNTLSNLNANSDSMTNVRPASGPVTSINVTNNLNSGY